MTNDTSIDASIERIMDLLQQSLESQSRLEKQQFDLAQKQNEMFELLSIANWVGSGQQDNLRQTNNREASVEVAPAEPARQDQNLLTDQLAVLKLENETLLNQKNESEEGRLEASADNDELRQNHESLVDEIAQLKLSLSSSGATQPETAITQPLTEPNLVASALSEGARVADETEFGVDEDDSWEAQKKRLMESYGNESDEDSTHVPEAHSSEEQTPANCTLNSLTISEIVQRVPDSELRSRNISEIAETNIEAPTEEESSDDASTLPPTKSQIAADKLLNETTRKTEIELSLERAKISRQRKALEEKIFLIQQKSKIHRESKPNPDRLLTRMTKFLRRDETSRERSQIDEMMDLIEDIDRKNKARYQADFYDPRDQFFDEEENSTEVVPLDSNTKNELSTESGDPGDDLAGIEEFMPSCQVDRETKSQTEPLTVSSDEIDEEAIVEFLLDDDKEMESGRIALTESESAAADDSADTDLPADSDLPAAKSNDRKPKKRKRRRNRKR